MAVSSNKLWTDYRYGDGFESRPWFQTATPKTKPQQLAEYRLSHSYIYLYAFKDIDSI